MLDRIYDSSEKTSLLAINSMHSKKKDHIQCAQSYLVCTSAHLRKTNLDVIPGFNLCRKNMRAKINDTVSVNSLCQSMV